MRACIFLFILGAASFAWSASFIVNDGGADCPNSLVATHTTVQGAIDAAVAHVDMTSDIQVCPGTYAENISMMNAADKTITLKGIGADHTTVIITGAGGGPGPIVNVDGLGTVHISDLTVDGQSMMTPTAMFGAVEGIRYEETNGSIRQVEVKNIRNADGSAQGLAIRVQGARAGEFDPAMPPAEKSVEINENIIRNTSRIGILVDGLGASADIEENLIDGPSMPMVFAFNAIQISRSAKGKANKNVINDTVSPTPLTGGGAGVAIHCVDGVTVTKNVITNADLGIVIIDSQSNTVTENVVQVATNGVDVQVLGNFLGDPGCLSAPTPPESNMLKDNTILDALSTGFQLITFDTSIGSPTKNQLINNVAIGNFFAFFVSTGEQNTFASNLALGSTDFPSMSDQTTAGGADSGTFNGTNGKANTYGGNFCDNPDADQLCQGFGGGGATTQVLQRVEPSSEDALAAAVFPSLYRD